jgi:DNA-binding LytR/AlgR family response regulator
VRGPIRALQAEQNYVRVFTDAGDDLILASLAGLAGQLGDLGVQVHRSWWVAAEAVEGVSRTAAGQDVATLRGGLEAPIGRTFRREALARLSARLHQPPCA